MGSVTHEADMRFLVRQSVGTGYQIFSLLTPPIYTTLILLRRGRGAWSLNKFLRATWVGGLAGAVAGGCTAYGRYQYSNREFVHQRRLKATYDINRMRSQDHSIIGAVLMALLTPAILWNKGNIVHLIVGGTGLGSAMGILVYYVQVLTSDEPKKATAVVVEEKKPK